MKKFLIISLIFSLILFTAIIKNSTKKIDEEIFSTKENLNSLRREFENIKLALVLPDQHPFHFAILKDDVESYGEPVTHRDGSVSVYIKDRSGNNIEILRY